MTRVMKDSYEFGLHWIIAFVLIATFTVTTCMKQQHMLLAQSSSHMMVLAMKQTDKEVH